MYFIGIIITGNSPSRCGDVQGLLQDSERDSDPREEEERASQAAEAAGE